MSEDKTPDSANINKIDVCTNLMGIYQKTDKYSNRIIHGRSKFEHSQINTDTDINTDSNNSREWSNSIDNTLKESPTEKDGSTRFSISELDKKLKEIKRNKKKQKHFYSKSYSDETQKRNGSYITQELFQSRMKNITILMDPSLLINQHMCEIQLRILGHSKAAIAYEKKENLLGYPVTILSSFLTSSIMLSVSTDTGYNKFIIKYISLTLSIILFLSSISRNYFNFSRKFQSHDLSSKLYTSLLRFTEVRLTKSVINKTEKQDIFKDIVSQMSIIEQYERPIPSKINTCIRKEKELLDCV